LETILIDVPSELTVIRLDALGGPAKGRKSSGGQSLLQGYNFYLHGSFKPPSPPKRDLKTLITISGGANSIRLPPPIATKKRGGNEAIDDGDKSLGSNTKVVLCDVGCSLEQAKEAHETCGLRPVSVLWLLDSISHFSPQPLNDYVVGVQ